MNPSLLPAVRPAACRSGSCDSPCHCPLLRAWCPGVVAGSPQRSQSSSWCYEWKFGSQSFDLRSFKHIITKISGGEIRHRIGECACNLIRKFRFSLWLYNSFSHLYDLFLLNQLARVLLVQVKGVCCAFF